MKTGRQKKYDPERLLYRRQFILGPRFVDVLPSWQKIPISESLCLTAHPDLHVCRAAENDKSVTVLGDLLDPNSPETDNAAIVGTLLDRLREAASLDEFYTQTDALGGRWILIVADGRDARFYLDAGGMRHACYAVEGSADNPKVWCATQPGLLTKAIDLTPDQEAIEYIEAAKAHHTEYWWPTDRTRYREIRRVLPNHYVSLADGSSHRYWPVDPCGRMSLEECVVKCSRVLQGMMRAAHHRFDLLLSVTAGLDSRVLLAASREICNELHYFTLLDPRFSWYSPDIRIAARLLDAAGLEHEIDKCGSSADAEFAELYRLSVTDAHEAWIPRTQTMLHRVPERVSVDGTCSEMARCFFGPPSEHPQLLTARDVWTLTDLAPREFALAEIDRWLSTLGDTRGYDPLDLFYWEHRNGYWVASSYMECDIARDVTLPYNCRSLLEDMLSVNSEFRTLPQSILHTALVNHMWPLLLTEPVNPPDYPGPATQVAQRMEFLARRGLKRAGLFNVAKKIKNAVTRSVRRGG